MGYRTRVYYVKPWNKRNTSHEKQKAYFHLAAPRAKLRHIFFSFQSFFDHLDFVIFPPDEKGGSSLPVYAHVSTVLDSFVMVNTFFAFQTTKDWHQVFVADLRRRHRQPSNGRFEEGTRGRKSIIFTCRRRVG